MVTLRIVYIFNIIVAGQIGVSALTNPINAAKTTFESTYPSSEIIKLVGSFWLAIAIISCFGLWKPITFSPILLLQLIYKGTWLFFVALPAYSNNLSFPKSMTMFFIVWVTFLPFVIPWSKWFSITTT